MTAIQNTPYRRINYLQPNFEHTTNLYRSRLTASKVALCALPLLLLVVGLYELVIKNPAFILANCAIAIFNGSSYLIHQVRMLFSQQIPQLAHLVTVNALSGTLVAPRPRINQVPPLPNQQFTPDELGAFRAALESRDRNEDPIIQIGDTLYALWYDQSTNSIKIQNGADYQSNNRNNLIEIAIDSPGRITSIAINGARHEQIPAEHLPIFRSSFLKSLELSSKYEWDGDRVKIQIIRRGLKEIPFYHLDQLARLIQQHPQGRISVHFLKNDLTQDVGTDAGGLSRDYFDDLFENLTKDGSLTYCKNAQTHLLMPANPTHQHTEPLSPEEKSFYRQMGQVMMYCYKSHQTLLIGKRFDDALFAALFSLEPEEIAREALSEETKLKLCEQIATAQNEPQESIRLIRLARKGNAISEQELREIEEFLDLGGQLPDGFDHNGFNPRNPAQADIVKKALINSLLEKAGVGESLEAIHALAKGMQKVLAAYPGDPWRPVLSLQQIAPRDFNRKIQGSLDRITLCDQIQVDYHLNHVIRTKVNWLKEWIRNEATEEELQKFVKFVSGASSLPPRQEIRVQTQDPPLPAPSAHSCFFQLDISPVDASYGNYHDRDKPNFIQSLKELALTDPTGYSMC